MTPSDGWGAEEFRREFTELALARCQEACEEEDCVPAVLVGVSPLPGGRWKIHVVTSTDGPLMDDEVLRLLGGYLCELVADVQAEQAEENGQKGGES